MRTALEAAYVGRRVLVTGHTGFKGAWLSAWLTELGAEVAGLALPPHTTPDLFSLMALSGEMDHRIGDVREAGTVHDRVAEVEPDIIFHLAAQALVRPAYQDPAGTFETNVMGTVHLLEAVRQVARPVAVLVVTSDKAYQDSDAGRGGPRFREADCLGGTDPYSASKAAAEMVIQAYRQSYFPVDRLHEHGVGLAVARAGNVLGGGDWSQDRILADLAAAVAAHRPLQVRHPDAIRPWQHVLDALAGYLWLGAGLLGKDAPALAGAWNFGPVDAAVWTVGELVSRAVEWWGQGGWEKVVQEGAPAEAACLQLDASKAVRLLGWQPVWNMDAVLERTVDWYRRQAAGEEMRAVSHQQIRQHTTEAAALGRPWAQPADMGVPRA